MFITGNYSFATSRGLTSEQFQVVEQHMDHQMFFPNSSVSKTSDQAVTVVYIDLCVFWPPDAVLPVLVQSS